MTTRRNFLTGAAAVAGGAATLGYTGGASAATRQWESSYSGGSLNVKPQSPGKPGRDYDPVVIPNGGLVPSKIVGGVRVFHMTVSEIDHEFAPGLNAYCWGYSGRVNSSVLEAVEGERVRIYVENQLPTPTTVHWHGLFLPNGMDGVSGITQPPIPPGETYIYEWTLRQHGTFMYHSHHDAMTQEGMGLTGMFVIHPRNRTAEDKVDRDFAIMLNEYRVDPGTRRPDPNEMTDFNVLTMNGRCFPGTEPLVIKTNDRVRIRLGNLSAMDHHPIHLHGYKFKVVATDGEKIPVAGQWPETSVLVAVGQTREIEFIADAPGDWLMHCHMTHHTMNQMGHDVPNVIGTNLDNLDRQVNSLVPGYMTMGQYGMSEHGQHVAAGLPVPENSIPMVGAQGQYGYTAMGGMFTIVKVRDNLASYDEDPGWYQHPKGTVSYKASAEQLRRDGIKVSDRKPVKPGKSMSGGHQHG